MDDMKLSSRRDVESYRRYYYVGNGMVVNDLILDGDYMDVAFGGVTGNISVNAGALQRIDVGGHAVGSFLRNGGVQDVYGLATDTTVYAQSVQNVYKEISKTTVAFQGAVNIFSGAIAREVYQEVGGNVNVTVAAGDLKTLVTGTNETGSFFMANGTASGFVVNAGGKHRVGVGGVSIGLTQRVGGNVDVAVSGGDTKTRVEGVNANGAFGLKNGVAENFMIYAGGRMDVADGGWAKNTEMSGGVMNVAIGGKATDIVQKDDACVNVEVRGGDARTVVNGTNAKGKFSLANGVADNFLIGAGGLHQVFGGGESHRLTVNAGGSAQAFSGSVLSDLTVNAGGGVWLESGVRLSGSLTVAGEVHGSGSVDASGSVVCLALQHRSSEDSFMVTQLDLFQGATYTVTVSNTQATGLYRLSEKIKNPSIVISLFDTAKNQLGNLRVNSTLTCGFYQYTLAVTDGSLFLNVGKLKMNAPKITADITRPTNQNVKLSAVFDSMSVRSEYSLDGKKWYAYSAPVTVLANATVYFRSYRSDGTLASGEYVVSNIDKVPPEKPQIAADVTRPTNQSVQLSANFSADSVLKEYSLDGKTWRAYSGSVRVDANGVVYFRATDLAGNSSINTYEVTNIKKTPPEKPQITADITRPTNQIVTLTLKLAADALVNEYSLDGVNWRRCGDELKISANGTVYVRSFDAVGNMSSNSYTVKNIDRVAPDKPRLSLSEKAPTCDSVTIFADFAGDAVRNEYSFDGKTWQLCTGSVTVDANGTVFFRSFDAAGNGSADSITVNNISKLPPLQPVISVSNENPTNQSVTLTVVFAENSVRNEYSLDGIEWQRYNDGVVMSHNGVVHFRSFDAVGNSSQSSYTVNNIDKSAPDAPRLTPSTTCRVNGSVLVVAEFSKDAKVREYSLDGKNWLTYTKPIEVKSNSTVMVRAYDAAGNVAQSQYEVKNILPLTDKGPEAVVVAQKVSKYNVTLSWKAPTAYDKAKVVGYEVEVNGKITYVKGRSLTLKNFAISSGNCVTVRAIDSFGRYGEVSRFTHFDVKDVTLPTLGKLFSAQQKYSATVNWSGSDNVGIVRYVVTCGSKRFELKDAKITLDDLAIGKHVITVQGFDAAGNGSSIKKIAVTVKDSTPPDPIGTLTVTAIDPAKYRVRLQWAPGVDNSGKIAYYQVRLDNGKVYKTSKNYLELSALPVGNHSFTVRAVDKNKNFGEWSAPGSFTLKDVTPPNSISVKNRVIGSSLVLTWATPKDNVGVVGYELRYGANLEKSIRLEAAQLGYTITQLPGGRCRYSLSAFDAAGNFSKPKTGSAVIKNGYVAALTLELPDEIPSLTLPEPARSGKSGAALDLSARLNEFAQPESLSLSSCAASDWEETLKRQADSVKLAMLA